MQNFMERRGAMKHLYIDQSGRGIRAGVENEAVCFPMETPEEFGKPGFLLCIKHQDAGTVLDYVCKRCDELRLIEP